MKQDYNVQNGVHGKIQILVNVPSYDNQKKDVKEILTGITDD